MVATGSSLALYHVITNMKRRSWIDHILEGEIFGVGVNKQPQSMGMLNSIASQKRLALWEVLGMLNSIARQKRLALREVLAMVQGTLLQGPALPSKVCICFFYIILV